MINTLVSKIQGGGWRSAIQAGIVYVLTQQWVIDLADWFGWTVDTVAVTGAVTGAVMWAYWEVMTRLQGSAFVNGNVVLRMLFSGLMGGGNSPTYE